MNGNNDIHVLFNTIDETHAAALDHVKEGKDLLDQVGCFGNDNDAVMNDENGHLKRSANDMRSTEDEEDEDTFFARMTRNAID